MITNVIDFIKDYSAQVVNSKYALLLWKVIIAIVVVILIFQLSKIIKKYLKKGFKKVKMEEGIANFLASCVSVGVLIIAIFFVAQTLGVDAASIVALLGSAGVTIGLAIQGSLSNISGGVLILILKPFKVGDYIIENSGKNEGTVIEIGLIYTKLLTLDSKTVILPNGSLANSSLVNVTDTPVRLVDLSFDIAYDADVNKAKELIHEVIMNDVDTLKEKPVTIAMISWEASSVRLCGKFYVENKNFFTSKCRVLENVKYAFDENGIEIPYPQLVVHKES